MTTEAGSGTIATAVMIRTPWLPLPRVTVGAKEEVLSAG